MVSTRHRLLLLAGAALLLSASPAARVFAAEGDEDFSYVPGANNGPENWGKINPNCSMGSKQSPINISRDRAIVNRSLGYLNSSYRSAQASIVNTGHDIKVKFEGDAGRLVIDGTAYKLQELHWHTPAEHTVDGRRYDMELHIVHRNGPAGNYAVIGILYEVGSPDAFLRTLEPYIKSISGKKNMSKPIGMVDPGIAKGEDTVYYRYMGSLTTPPCTEGVVWTIVRRIRTVAKYQVDLLKKALTDGNENNARPLQKLNGRNISIFTPNPL